MSDGPLEKVRIVAYKDKNLQNEKYPEPYFLPLNPESYSQNLKIETDNRRGHGNQGTDPRYKSTVPEKLKLEFVLDGTGAIENYRYTDAAKTTAKDQLELFLKTVYLIDGKTHRPNFLKVHWGEFLKFPCVLSDLDINYQLFEPNGDPLRIKISATFLSYRGPEQRVAEERRSSPDLTHMKETKAGDRLDLMTQDIYNDTKHLLQVARVNGLTSIRTLKPGTQLRFPPINKTEDKVGAT